MCQYYTSNPMNEDTASLGLSAMLGSLPPHVEGKVNGYLSMTVDSFRWRCNLNGKVHIRVSWWGEKQKILLLPQVTDGSDKSHVSFKNTRVYRVMTNTELFLSYLQDCEVLNFEVYEQGVDCLMGTATLKHLMSVVLNNPWTESCVVSDKNGTEIADLRISFVFHQNELTFGTSDIKNKSERERTFERILGCEIDETLNSARRNSKYTDGKSCDSDPCPKSLTESRMESMEKVAGNNNTIENADVVSNSTISELLERCYNIRQEYHGNGRRCMQYSKNNVGRSLESSELKIRGKSIIRDEELAAFETVKFHSPMQEFIQLAESSHQNFERNVKCGNSSHVKIPQDQLNVSFQKVLFQSESGDFNVFEKQRKDSRNEEKKKGTGKHSNGIHFHRQMIHMLASQKPRFMELLCSSTITFKLYSRHVSQRLPCLLGKASLSLGNVIKKCAFNALLELTIHPESNSNPSCMLSLGILKLKVEFGANRTCFNQKPVSSIDCRSLQSSSESEYDCRNTDSCTMKIPSKGSANKQSRPNEKMICNAHAKCSKYTSQENITKNSHEVGCKTSRKCSGEKEIMPVLLSLELIDRCYNNFMVVEVWSLSGLVGIAKLPLNQFYIAFRDPPVVEQLLMTKYPIISVDGWVDVVDPVSQHQVGKLKVVLALGTENQIQMLEMTRCMKEGILNPQTVSQPVTAELDPITSRSTTPINSSAEQEPASKVTSGECFQNGRNCNYSADKHLQVIKGIISRESLLACGDYSNEYLQKLIHEESDQNEHFVERKSSSLQSSQNSHVFRARSFHTAFSGSSVNDCSGVVDFPETSLVEEIVPAVVRAHSNFDPFDVSKGNPSLRTNLSSTRGPKCVSQSGIKTVPKLNSDIKVKNGLQLSFVETDQNSKSVANVFGEDVSSHLNEEIDTTKRKCGSVSTDNTVDALSTDELSISNNIFDSTPHHNVEEDSSFIGKSITVLEETSINENDSKYKYVENSPNDSKNEYVEDRLYNGLNKTLTVEDLNNISKDNIDFGDREPSDLPNYQLCKSSDSAIIAALTENASTQTDVLNDQNFFSNGRCLILKVWHKKDYDSEHPNALEDLVIGFVALDLQVLVCGLPCISGWFNICDISGSCKGQIQISVTPLENVSLIVNKTRYNVKEKENRDFTEATMTHFLPSPLDEFAESLHQGPAFAEKNSILSSISHDVKDFLILSSESSKEICQSPCIDRNEYSQACYKSSSKKDSVSSKFREILSVCANQRQFKNPEKVNNSQEQINSVSSNPEKLSPIVSNQNCSEYLRSISYERSSSLMETLRQKFQELDNIIHQMQSKTDPLSKTKPEIICSENKMNKLPDHEYCSGNILCCRSQSTNISEGAESDNDFLAHNCKIFSAVKEGVSNNEHLNGNTSWTLPMQESESVFYNSSSIVIPVGCKNATINESKSQGEREKNSVTNVSEEVLVTDLMTDYLMTEALHDLDLENIFNPLLFQHILANHQRQRCCPHWLSETNGSSFPCDTDPSSQLPSKRNKRHFWKSQKLMKILSRIPDETCIDEGELVFSDMNQDRKSTDDTKNEVLPCQAIEDRIQIHSRNEREAFLANSESSAPFVLENISFSKCINKENVGKTSHSNETKYLLKSNLKEVDCPSSIQFLNITKPSSHSSKKIVYAPINSHMNSHHKIRDVASSDDVKDVEECRNCNSKLKNKNSTKYPVVSTISSKKSYTLDSSEGIELSDGINKSSDEERQFGKVDLKKDQVQEKV
ncbi:C2 domain-containing protein 3 [Gryllus bimaculatus]|nr:C2 domain-containing protein 3 [Gryllus bimaculatus]